MKDLFPGYYSPSDEDFLELWQKCIFIFDTNVILDFYEHRNETHEDFFKVLDAINFKVLDAIKDRLWIPHQIALEYHENRINRIKQAESNFTTAKKLLDQTTETLSQNFNSQCFPPEVVQEMRENVKKVFDTFWDKLTSCREELIQIRGISRDSAP
ncbi:PIN-like domain-containing protein [Microcoleus sp. B9-D4]|uniref:PIN-like domain-containing protein n=1 Tax=Microcoleus sp. B9-D4 TaxID=2818711 RepID=UPI002FD72CCE